MMTPGRPFSIVLPREKRAGLRVGGWHTIATGDDGRKLDMLCIAIAGDLVTFAVPQVAEA